jgi:FkbM family methyltransferase
MFFQRSAVPKIAVGIIALITVVIVFIVFGANVNTSDEESGPIATRNQQQRERKQVFLDFGANTGDSLRSFTFGEKANQGGHALLGRGGKDSGKWDIWGFEPNPAFNDKLKTLENELKEAKLSNGEPRYNVHIFRESVANVVGGKVDFYLDTVNPEHNFWGSSLKENHPDVIKSKKAKIQVDSYDVAKLIMENYTKDDFIIIKMDVEGSEYDIVPYFMKVGVLEYIDEFACEWHKYMEPADAKGITGYLQYIMTTAGVKLLDWT